MRDRLMTTEARAKELAPIAEKIITIAKKGDPSSRKNIARRLSPPAADKLAKVIAPYFRQRRGGYTRIIKLGQRSSDSSKRVILELVK